MTQVVVELTGDEQKLLKAYQKVRDSQNQMDKGLKNIKGSARGAGKAAQGAGRQMQETFGSKAKAMVMSYAAGIGAVQAAVGVLRGAMNLLREDSERAIRVVDSVIDSSRELGQVLSGEESDRATRRRRRLARDEGVPIPEIQRLQFARESINLSREGVERITQAAGANLLTTAGAQTAGGEVPLLFRDQGVTTLQAINAILLGSQKSPATFGEVARYMPQAAAGTTQQGMGLAETTSSLTLMRERFKMETAADRLKSFTAKLSMRPEFEGKTLAESVRMLQGDEALREDFLGTTLELREAYGALEKVGVRRLEKRTKETQKAIARAGTPESYLMESIRDRLDPTTEMGRLTIAWRERRRAQREQDIKDLEEAPGALTREAGGIRRGAELQGEVDPITRFLRGKVREFGRGMKAPPQATGFAEQYMHYVSGGPVRTGMMQILDRWTQSIERQEEAAESQKEAAAEQREAAQDTAQTRRQREAVQGVPE